MTVEEALEVIIKKNMINAHKYEHNLFYLLVMNIL